MNSTTAVTEQPQAPAMPEQSRGSHVLQFVEQLGTELSNGTLNLPSFPDPVVRIQQVLNDRNATTLRVAQVIKGEPVFTAKLFRMANSVMLQRGDTALTDLNAVINRLGFDMIRNLAVALATRQIMNAKKYGALHKELRELWEHGVETATIAYMLAEQSGRVSTDDAVLAGLIHDIGAFYIYSRMSGHADLFRDRDTVAGVVDDWHTGIGHAILEAWDFPESVVVAVDEHETWDRVHVGHADLTDVVVVANLLARWGTPAQKAVDLETLPALERLKLTPDSALQMLESSHEAADAMKSVLS